MADPAAAAQFAPRTMKRKNKMGLAIGGPPAAPSTGMSLSNGGREIRVNKRDTLVHQLSNLEIGVEFKLDLRAEDLEVIHELGAGNGGTVSKVIHKATKTVMARKVSFVPQEDRFIDTS